MLLQPVFAHAFGLTECAASRKASDLGCTAADVSITGIAIATGGPLSCVGGTTIPIDLDITVNFAVPDRWDIGIFLTNDGKDPKLLPANGGSATCSVGILPTTAPFLNLDSNGGTDTCGDGNGTINGGTGSGIFRMNSVPVACQAINMSGGKLYIPFVVSWDNQASPSGATCTSTADPVPNTISKCNSPKTTIAADVAYGTVNAVVLPSISKTDGRTTISTGDSTTYTVVVTNTTGVPLSGAVFSDPAVADLSVGSVSCNPIGGATCPATSVAAMQGAGISIPAMPVGSSVTFTINATMTGNPVGSLINTARVTVSGQTNTASDSNTIIIRPALTVTKTASQTPLVVGKPGQFFTINIAVANGPTTAPITIADVLPAGITTSGVITATGGSLSGCPAAGAINLTGCSIATGAVTGNIFVTVPVTVSAATANPSINSATVTGGGDTTCPAGLNCSGTVSTPVIDAIDDAATKQPGIASSTDVSTNDKYPVGATFSQTATTCAPAGSMTGAGVASYTSPALAGNTCTVDYRVCDATFPAICDTAVLTVTASAAPALTVSKTASQTPLVVGKVGQFYTINIAVANGPTTAPITIADALPAGITTSGVITAIGGSLSGCPAAGAANLTGCSIATGAVNGTIAVTVPVTVGAATANPSTNSATVSGGGDTACPAGLNCSGSVSTPVIDAVNETDTKQPGTAASSDVSTNDKYPALSTFSQTATTCAPAGSMTGAGVASYTSPALAGNTCTVDYKVCDATFPAICDTAVLTVTASAAPALTVSKTASQTPLVVGKVGQFYTINIAVANGLTTAPITIADALPAGITTSGVITATGGSLSGCPAAGAANLTGCSIATGALTGTIAVTVPVTVAAATVNPSTNSATVTGGGDTTCPAGANCSGSVSTPVIDAIDDAATKQPGILTSSDVSVNDKYPVGSTFSQTATTCAPAGSMTGAGVASYTSPALAGNTCTVNYQVCAPVPNAGVCDTAVLTVTASTAPALTVSKTASQTPLVVGKPGQFYTITIAVANGPTTAPITIADVLPAGITTSGVITAAGGSLSGCPAAGAANLTGCSIATGAVTGTIAVTVPVTVAAATANPSTNSATVTGGGDTTCPAGLNCSGTVSTPVIDAVNDVDTKQPSTAASSDVSTNDKYPVGATFSQTATTCAPAGSMTGAGVASYTSPALAGNTCTVDYKVCDATFPAICDTAVLTVTASTAPALTVTKTASQTPLVVGKPGQFYTINIAVANGPATAPITIADVLPAGITTSGVITATGGTLSGCPAAGALNLTGCSIAAGAVTGNIVVTVPVTVSAAAANPSTNSATVSGGGDTTCPAGINCSGSVTTPVIDAIDDAATKQPGIASSTDVSTNDKYPVGATFSQIATTCAPAGSMTGAGVASYTSPALAGNTCTVDYKVCDATFPAICDTAVLTVTASADPALTVTKTASQTPLVVGQLGQFYTINIAVANGPTTAPITIADALPAGITTSGVIIATGGTLSGCPAAGALNLTGCSIAAGAVTGNIVVTVPVTVSAATANPSTNSATVTGGGDTACPAGLNCSGSVSTPVIDAVNDVDTKQPGIASSTDVSTNDKYPIGSTFSQTATTCAPAGSTTGAGVASYTSPALAGNTCTVNYQVCAPVPNAGVCDSAVLTVTASTAPALTVTKTASQTPLVVGKPGQFYTITIAVANGPTTAPITIADVLPAGITTSGVITATGGSLSGCPAAGAANLTGCSIATGAVTGTIAVTVPVSVAAATANPSTNSATVTGGGDTACPAGINCSGSVSTPVIDAVNDVDTKQPGIASSTDVSTNDKYPASSTFTIQPGSSCAAPAVSLAGLASYTSPALAGNTCTVNYQVCAPAPNAGVCDSAVLTVYSLGSVSGSVYLDSNDNGVKDAGETGIGNVIITLSGSDDIGAAVSTSVFSAADGSYIITGLRPSGPGGYTLTETQPLTYDDGRETAGNRGGTVDNSIFNSTPAQNRISSIVFPAVGNASGYLFSEHPGQAARVSGKIWYNSIIRDQAQQPGEPGLSGWLVEAVRGGVIQGTATSISDGSYEISFLPAGTGYELRFRHPGNRALYGDPLSQDPVYADSVLDLSAHTIANLTLRSGGNVVQQNLPIDPSGIVYDAISRNPLPGATVTINGPTGFDPTIHLVGGVGNQSQVMDSTAFYQFMLLPGAPVGTYTLTVIAPPGYVPGVSTLIPPTAGPFNPGPGPLNVAIQAQATPPTLSQVSTYYLSFALNGASAGVIHNHIPVDPIMGGNIRISKTTPLLNVSKGDLVPYTIEATNAMSSTIPGVDLVDQVPPGFKYRSGSATLNGVAVEPMISSRTLRWPNLTFNASEKKTIKLILVVGAGVGEGTYTNQAWAQNNIAAATISNIGEASVRIIPDPTFDCSDIIGKVFDDRNANGYQDDGEPGIADVRIATARGWLVTSDADGRFHVACAAIPQADRGSNFIMKLDERTLPSGYRITTENPRVVRATRGKMLKLNFGATIHRVVRVEVNDVAFNGDGTELLPDWGKRFDDLPGQLRERPSVVRLAYRVENGNRSKAEQRLDILTKLLRARWEALNCCYALSIEQEIVEVDR